MSADQEQETITTTGEQGSDLVVNLETIMPSALSAGRGAAVFCVGSCFHRREAIKDLEIVVDGVRHRPTAFAMPRPDVLSSLQGARVSKTSSSLAGGRPFANDLEIRGYRSGFWATIPVMPRARRGWVELLLTARLEGGAEVTSDLGRLEVVEPEPPLPAPPVDDVGGHALIAVCMATFEPDMRLFQVQIDSLRSQSDGRWICLISDDCSNPERFEEIKRVVEGDPRFVVSRSDRRLGFYRNFERALSMVPPEAQFVALSDQDDRWHPDKLEGLRGALGSAQLVYSDQRLVDAEGHVLRSTLWKGRRNNYRNLASQVIANTIGGAAMLLRRELLELALPFPDAPGFLFHDHWLGMVAMASGEVAFVDRPLYDYVQHVGAVFGHVTHGPGVSTPETGSRWRGPRRKWWRGHFERWRAAYFYGYLSREVLVQTLLVRCEPTLTPTKRRTLRRFVASASSPIAFAWLAARPLRAALGLNETLGSEMDLVQGILWRWLIPLRATRARTPDRMTYDGSLPDPGIFEQQRLRRWRARL